MSLLNKSKVEQYTPLLKPLSPASTSSNGTPPSFTSFVKTKDVGSIIALMDMFGIKRYYEVESQSDIVSLVDECRNGMSMEIQWFYLTMNEVNELSERVLIQELIL